MNDSPSKPDPLDGLIARALAKAPELVPGSDPRSYRRGDYAAAQRRRERRKMNTPRRTR